MTRRDEKRMKVYTPRLWCMCDKGKFEVSGFIFYITIWRSSSRRRSISDYIMILHVNVKSLFLSL